MIAEIENERFLKQMVFVQFCHRLTHDTVDDLHTVEVSGESVAEKRRVRKVRGGGDSPQQDRESSFRFQK